MGSDATWNYHPFLCEQDPRRATVHRWAPNEQEIPLQSRIHCELAFPLQTVSDTRSVYHRRKNTTGTSAIFRYNSLYFVTVITCTQFSSGPRSVTPSWHFNSIMVPFFVLCTYGLCSRKYHYIPHVAHDNDDRNRGNKIILKQNHSI